MGAMWGREAGKLLWGREVGVELPATLLVLTVLWIKATVNLAVTSAELMLYFLSVVL